MKPNDPDKTEIKASPPPPATVRPPDTFGDPDLALLEEAIEVTESNTQESAGG